MEKFLDPQYIKSLISGLEETQRTSLLELRKEGTRRLRAGNVGEALALWSHVVLHEPGEEYAVNQLSQIYMSCNWVAELRDLLSRAYQAHPSSVIIRKRLARLLKRDRDFAESIAVWDQLLQDENDFDSRLSLFQCLLELGDQRRVQELVSNEVVAADRAILLAEKAYYQELWEEATGFLKQALSSDGREHDLSIWRRLAAIARSKDGERGNQSYGKQIAADARTIFAGAALSAIYENAGLLCLAEGTLRAEFSNLLTEDALLDIVRYLLRHDRFFEAWEMLNDPPEQVELSFKAFRERFCFSVILSNLGITPSQVPEYREESLQAIAFERLLSSHAVRTQATRHVQPIKVLVVLGVLGAGGAERQIVNLAHGVGNYPERVSELGVYCIRPLSSELETFYLRQFPEMEISSHVHGRKWTHAEHEFFGKYELYLRHFHPNLAEPVRQLLSYVQTQKPDVIYACLDNACLVAGLVGALLGVPRVIASFRNLPVPDREIGEPVLESQKFTRSAFRALRSLTDIQFSALSDAAGAGYAHWLDFPSQEVRTVYNGVDTSRLRFSQETIAEHRACLGIPAGAPIIGGVFRLHPQKRPLQWVSVAEEIGKEIPEAHFLVLGKGTIRWEVEKRVADSYLRDRFHLLAPQQDIANWIKLMDVFMMTTQAEGLCNAVLESQFLGVPVVVPAVGGIVEALLDGETGFLVGINDFAALRDRVVELMRNTEKRAEMGNRGRRFIEEKFSMDAFLRNTIDLFDGQEVLKESAVSERSLGR